MDKPAAPDRSERLAAGLDDANNRFDPALAEKKIESERSSTHGGRSAAAEHENVDDRLWVTDDEAYARARLHPDDTRPMYVIFAPDDEENPRNWSTVKKWYITCFVSFLNVMTCLCAGGYSSGAPALVKEFGVSTEVGTLGLSMYILVCGRKVWIWQCFTLTIK